MVIFNSYVKLPEGNSQQFYYFGFQTILMTRFAGSSCCGHARIGDASEHADNSIYDMYGHLDMNKLGRLQPWDLDGFGVLHLYGKKRMYSTHPNTSW